MTGPKARLYLNVNKKDFKQEVPFVSAFPNPSPAITDHGLQSNLPFALYFGSLYYKCYGPRSDYCSLRGSLTVGIQCLLIW